jgi:hypothetical protein
MSKRQEVLGVGDILAGPGQYERKQLREARQEQRWAKRSSDTVVTYPDGTTEVIPNRRPKRKRPRRASR